MSIYVDYYYDHDLDASCVKGMIAEMEKRLGYKLRWDYDVPLSEKSNGYYLYWEPDVNTLENGYEPFDESKDECIERLILKYYENQYCHIQLHTYHKHFGIWNTIKGMPFPPYFMDALNRLLGRKTQMLSDLYSDPNIPPPLKFLENTLPTTAF